MSGRSWSGQWGIVQREWQPRGRSAEGPILNRLAGRNYSINESRDGEWTVKWLDANGDVVARFGGDVRLVFVALQHLANRTEAEFGIVVDRAWQREPELSEAMQGLSDTTVRLPAADTTKRVRRLRKR